MGKYLTFAIILLIGLLALFYGGFLQRFYQSEPVASVPKPKNISNINDTDRVNKLSLTLPPAEVEKALDQSDPLQEVLPQKLEGQSSSEVLKSPISVELTEKDTPIVQFNFEQKSAVAEKADLEDKFDGSLSATEEEP